MPIYPFVCKRCGERREEWQKWEDPAPRCNYCSVPMDREIGEGTDFILKGGGWYGKARFSTRGMKSGR